MCLLQVILFVLKAVDFYDGDGRDTHLQAFPYCLKAITIAAYVETSTWSNSAKRTITKESGTLLL